MYDQQVAAMREKATDHAARTTAHTTTIETLKHEREEHRRAHTTAIEQAAQAVEQVAAAKKEAEAVKQEAEALTKHHEQRLNETENSHFAMAAELSTAHDAGTLNGYLERPL